MWKRSILIPAYLLFCLCFAMPMAANEQRPDSVTELAMKLPSKPAVAAAADIALLEKAAQTQRLDGAMLLIRGLAFNIDPTNRNETAADTMLPALPLLQRYFGDDALPLLYYVAAGSDEEWLRNRIAATVLKMAAPARIAELNRTFSLADSKQPSSQAFLRALSGQKLNLFYATPQTQGHDAIDRAVQGIRERKKNP